MDFFDSKLMSAFMAAACWGLVPLGLKLGIESGDQRWTMLAFISLAAGYYCQLPILQESMGYAIVVTSAFTQLVALGIAFLWFGEVLNANRIAGIFLSLGAIVAFSLPENTRF